ncbi:MAG: hypothetical protein BWX80_02888 [Candidatus Hydrogenedentes bacterium ADurb.Bin101]|nr:MAG: hypothetical protein BWX80_02888 [Candidatus Hydrogenedentes bacterium ADurb.Bin101]HOC69180.1 hypothetical protein [Candidatus Hydrogenedentota bacterium]
MKQVFFAIVLPAVLASAMVMAAEGASIPITGTEAPTSLQTIAGTPTMLTVVLKDSGARDPNLKLLELRQDRLILMNQKGDIVPYMMDSIESLEVQGGLVEKRHTQALDSQVLKAEHQRVVQRAWARAREIYGESDDNQGLKIQAATMLALSNDEDAHNYLRNLAESNDIETQLGAAGALYLVGDTVSEALLGQGLDSGNRNARVKAASLAGLCGYQNGVILLRSMFQDRAVQLSTPAARALARLGVRDILPGLMKMIFELHADKGKAAIFGMTRLGDAALVEDLKFRLLEAEGVVRFRLVEVLFNLNDPVGVEELKDIFKNYPTLSPEVALLLARHGDYEATQYLRNRLSRREDPTEENLSYRARNAQALLQGGDPTAMAVFQELLRVNNENVTELVFELMTELGQASLITLLQPSIENVDKEYAMNACKAVIALAMPEFRERLLSYREEFGV